MRCVQLSLSPPLVCRMLLRLSISGVAPRVCVCVCVCLCVCARARVRACVRACVWLCLWLCSGWGRVPIQGASGRGVFELLAGIVAFTNQSADDAAGGIVLV